MGMYIQKVGGEKKGGGGREREEEQKQETFSVVLKVIEHTDSNSK